MIEELRVSRIYPALCCSPVIYLRAIVSLDDERPQYASYART
jgi:hypothetical protein